MRAGRTITSQFKTDRKAPASAYVAGLVCLLGVLWLSAAPMLAAAGCGVLPHDHLLLGGAGAPELAAHRAEEAACASGHSTSSPAAVAHVTGEIVSVVRVAPEPGPSGSVLGLDQIAMAVPTLLISCGLLLSFMWSMPSSQLMGRSLIPSPIDHPPETCGPYVTP